MSDRPERDERDVDAEFDAEFAAIIARWEDAPAEPVREARADQDAPVAEPVPVPEADAAAAPAADADPAAPVDEDDSDAAAPASTTPALGSIPVWRGARVTPEQVWDREAQEHYDPPPPRPLPPQEDLSFWGIIGGLVGGPLLLLWLVIFRPDVSSWWTFGALGLTVAGFVLLVMRQPHSRDDDPDDGAVV